MFDYFTPPFSLQAGPTQDVTALQQQVDDLSDDFTNHTHTYQTGKNKNHNAVTATTGPAMPAAP